MESFDRLPEELEIPQIGIHYLYSFLFSSLNYDDLLKVFGGDSQQLCKCIRDIEARLSNTRQEKIPWKRHLNPYEKVAFHDGRLDGMKTYPRVNLKIQHLEFAGDLTDTVHISSKTGEETNASFTYRMMLLESGAGVLCFQLTFDKKEEGRWRKEEIIDVSNLGELGEEKTTYRLSYDNQDFSLYKIFVTEVEFLKDVIKSLLIEKELLRPTADEPDRFYWVEFGNKTQERLLAGSSLAEPTQVPYVMIVLADIDPLLYAFFVDGDLQSLSHYTESIDRSISPERRYYLRRYVRDLCAILVRSHSPNDIDLSFFEKHQLLKNERLANMCGTEKFFLVFHTRSSVAMYKRGEALTTLTKESIEALHSTLLLLRLRWYALLVTNARLDAQLKKVQRQVDAIVDHYRLQEKETTLSKDLELDRMQLEIFSIKEELLRNLQDPISYRAHFGSMLEIYETGAEKFRIYEMQSVILGKISNLDSLFEMMKEMKFLIRYQRIG